MNNMDFLAFVRSQHARPDAAGNVARAILHEHEKLALPSLNLQHELQEEAETEGSYRGLKDLWNLWLEHQDKDAQRFRNP